MLSKLRGVAGSFIPRHRLSKPVRIAHRLATFIEDSYQNENLDLSTNGELRVLQALRPTGVRTLFDVGANIGDWSIEALHAWPTAQSRSSRNGGRCCRWVGKVYPSYVDFTDYTWRFEGFRFANFLAASRSRPDLLRLLAVDADRTR